MVKKQLLRNRLTIEWLSIIVLVIALAFIVHKYYSLKTVVEFDSQKPEPDLTEAELRHAADTYSSSLEGKKLPVASFTDLISKKDRISKFSELTIVVLFSINDCSPCLNYEMKNYQKLYKEFDGKISIIGLCTETLRGEIFLIRKINEVSFPIWASNDDALTTFVDLNKLPIVLLIKNQVILNAYFPSPGDTKHSIENLKKIKRFIISST